MLTTTQIVHEIEQLSKIDRIKVIDSVLDDFFHTDPESEIVWIEEAVLRIEQYESGKRQAIAYDEVMAQFKR